MFNPAEYHYDPEILAAHRASQEAARGNALDFGEGFSGGQDLSTVKGAAAWGTSGLSGQLLEELASSDRQLQWFIQRHGVDVANADINQLQAQIEAYKKEATLRELSPAEVSQARELVETRQDVIEGLTYAKNNAGGDLDAEIYEDGDSFNDRWGMANEEQDALSMFFKVASENPSYTAGAIVGELVKDFPLMAASIFGLSKVNSLGRAVRLVNRRLASITSKAGRISAQMGTGIGIGATSGAGYEAAYSYLDEGEVKGDDVWLGAEFGGLFGILGGLGIMKQSSMLKKGDKLVADVIDEAVSGAEGSLGKAVKGTEEAGSKGKEGLDLADRIDEDQDLISRQADKLDILPEHTQRVLPMPEGDGAIVKTAIGPETGDIITYVNEAKLEQQRVKLLEQTEDKIKKGESVEDITFRNIASLKNKEAFKAVTIAQQKVRGTYLKKKKEGEELPEDWEAEVMTITKAELDKYDAKFRAESDARRRDYELQQRTEELNSPEGQEAQAIGAKIEARKKLESEIKRLNSYPSLTKEDNAKLIELEAELRALDEAESVNMKPLGKMGQWIEDNPKKTIALGAVAGGTLIPGETSDNIYGVVAGAGVAFAGPKAYKAITRGAFNQAALRAKAAIQKGIEMSGRDMKILEMKMQSVTDEIAKRFSSHEDGLRFINYLESENNRDSKGKLILTKDELELGKEARAVLDLIWAKAKEAGVVKSKKDLMTGGFKDKAERGAFLHNYFPHLFNKRLTDEELAEMVKRWGTHTTGSSLQRQVTGSIDFLKKEFPAYADNLITSPTRALELYTQAMTRAIHGRTMLNNLKELDLSMGKGTFLPAMMSEKAFQILKRQGKLSDQEALHYVTFDHSSLEGHRVHTDMQGLVNDHFDVIRKGTFSEIKQSVLDINNGLKRIFVFGSLFHGQALLTSLAYSLGVKGAYHGLKGTHNKALTDGVMWHQLKLGSGEFKELAEHAMKFGLQIVNIKKQELVTPGRDQVNNVLDRLGQGGKVARKAFDGIDYITWEYFHDRFKLATFLRKEEQIVKNLKKKGWKDADARQKAGDEAAEFANDAFGSLDWDGFTTKLLDYAVENPTKLRGRIAGVASQVLPVAKRKWLNLGLFAPDWTVSNLRIVGRMFTLGYKYTDHQLKAIHRGQGWQTKEGQALLESFKMYAAYSGKAGVINSALWWTTMQLFSDKEPTMERLQDFWYGESSHKLDLGGGRSVVISKQIAEPIHWVQHPMHTFANKMSVVPKTGLELFMNKQWFSLKKDIPIGPALIDADGNYHHAKWLLGKVTPIVIKPIMQDDLSFGERVSGILGGFAGFPQYKIKE
jgi:hypothetical protein